MRIADGRFFDWRLPIWIADCRLHCGLTIWIADCRLHCGLMIWIADCRLGGVCRFGSAIADLDWDWRSRLRIQIADSRSSIWIDDLDWRFRLPIADWV